jgi:hypothetical protein
MMTTTATLIADQPTGRQVPAKPRRCPIGIIRAEITGSDKCEAEGYTARGSSPVLALCRLLVQAGVDPALALQCYRGDVLALRISNIGAGARLTVKTAGNGAPIFALDSTAGGAETPPIAPRARARVISIPQMANTATGVTP